MMLFKKIKTDFESIKEVLTFIKPKPELTEPEIFLSERNETTIAVTLQKRLRISAQRTLIFDFSDHNPLVMNALILSAQLLAAVYNPANRFINTNWVSKVSNKYVESINLRGGNYAVHYNKKSAQTYRGYYSVSKDTLIIKERDDSRGTASYHKIKLVLKGHELHYFSNEELLNHQWTKSKIQVDKNLVFTRI